MRSEQVGEDAGHPGRTVWWQSGSRALGLRETGQESHVWGTQARGVMEAVAYVNL